MVLYQRLDRFRCKLEGDFILRDHVDMNNVSLDVYDLVVEKSFDQWVLILSELRIRSLRQHDRAKSPYRRGPCKGLG